MMRFLAFVALLAAACSTYDPDTGAGDWQAREWEPLDHECPERTIIDCDGGTLECGSFCRVRESCTTVRNCRMAAPLRIYGEWMNVGQIEDSDWTRSDSYVAEMREQAPHSVRIENSIIAASDGRTPVYVGPGVSFLTLDRLWVEGSSRSVMVYIGAEATRIRILDARIRGTNAARGALAVDAADYVTVFDSELWGDVELYRNCGELSDYNEPITRHTTPREAEFRGTTIHGQLRPSARDGNKFYCLADDPFGDVGSARSNLDFAEVTVEDCTIDDGIVAGESAIVNVEQEE